MNTIEIIGIAASALTSLQVVFCYSGQLLKLMHCSPLEARGVHFGMHLVGMVSHGLWFIAGLGLDSAIIAIPNAIGSVLAGLISIRLAALRCNDTTTEPQVLT